MRFIPIRGGEGREISCRFSSLRGLPGTTGADRISISYSLTDSFGF